ncbi:hypothetical protein GCM10023323_00710 [Streptomyces thinghirensis]|uniref:Uncharacterized protein n=1 Tax=Streptomyces thinghirensis TaxID=551547 RepID=A0ABP9SW63_9ACTN
MGPRAAMCAATRADRDRPERPGGGEAHDMDLQGHARAGTSWGADDDADSERHRTAHPYRLELLNPRPAFDVREGTIPLALTRRVSLVTTSRNHRRFDAKNARMAAEALWLERVLAGRMPR